MKTNLKQIGLASFVVGILVFYGCKEDNNTISLPAVNDASLVEITVTSAVIKGVVLTEGSARVMSRGICWSTAPEPTIDDNKIIEGSGPGQFSARIPDLTPGASYYVRVFATNADGISYSQPLKITTPLTASPATLETYPISYLSYTSAMAGGKIISNGNGEISEKGVCWSTDPSPTIDKSKIVARTDSPDYILQITGLEPGTVYYVRAYAINSIGTSYGPEVTFETPFALGTRMSDLPGEGRYAAASFSIGDKIYMGFGYDVIGGINEDFWEWDQNTDKWTQLPDLPVVSMASYTTFTINGKGYIFTVVYNEGGPLANEFWEYDPVANRWTRKADLPESPARYYTTGFSIGSKGYIGLGTKGFSYDKTDYYKDFWEWDQASNTWTRKADFAGDARAGATGFSIGNKGYIGTGDGNAVYFWDDRPADPAWNTVGADYLNGLYADFWEYNQANDTWTRKADFKGSARKAATGFSIGNKGYIGVGYAPGSEDVASQDIWEWDQASDSWIKVGDFLGNPRAFNIGGSIGDRGYLAAGVALTGTKAGNTILNDLWVLNLTGVK